jgi:hypothetical protein
MRIIDGLNDEQRHALKLRLKSTEAKATKIYQRLGAQEKYTKATALSKEWEKVQRAMPLTALSTALDTFDKFMKDGRY